jgi:hypothetical protein
LFELSPRPLRSLPQSLHHIQTKTGSRIHGVAIKYKRTDGGGRRSDFHGRVTLFSTRKPIPPQKKLLIIYIGLGVSALLLFAYHVFSQHPVFEWDPVRSGEGTILDKWIDDLESGVEHWVRVEATADSNSGERTLTGEALLDSESWASLKTRDRVEITFRPHRSEAKMRIESMAQVAVDELP